MRKAALQVKFKKLYKALFVVFMVFMLSVSFAFTVLSDQVYFPESSFNSYSYTRWGDPVACPNPYTLLKTVTGTDLGVGDFKKPNDLFADEQGFLYLAVSGDQQTDNKIVKLDKDLKVIKEWYGYLGEDGGEIAFVEPLGVFVTPEQTVYVADGNSKKIIAINQDGGVERLIPAPTEKDSAIISTGFIERYRPSKLAVDSSGRLHVVAVNVNEGIVEFDPEGKFSGFLAAGKVNANPIEIIWKRLSTQEQLDRMSDFVPVEYNNISLDSEGFVFATLAAVDGKVVVSEIKSGKGTEQGALVKRLNTLGKDILRRKGFGPPVGDYDILGTDGNTVDTTYVGISNFVDVANGPDGTYMVFDSVRSRIFAYDSEGWLLFAFGGPDITNGGVRTPSSMAMLGDKLYLVDSNTRAITVYRRTEFGNKIFDANNFDAKGEYVKSAEKWQEVLDLNTNYDLAYSGIGRAAYRGGEYEKAMEYFELGNNTDWYSRAYKEYRKDIVAKWFAPVAIAVVVLVIVVLVSKKVSKRKKVQGDFKGTKKEGSA